MVDRALRLRLGLFMGGSLIALVGLIVLFGGAPQVFSNKARYAVLFPEAPGIGPGTPIRKSGVRIGEVIGLDLDADSGQVRVRIAVERKYLPRKSEEATITRGLLSGDTAIDFLPRLTPEGLPVPREEEWPPGSDIPGVPPITPRSLLSPASSAMANAQQSLDRITRTFEKFERIAPKLEQTADEAANLFKDVRGFIPELRKTNERIQNLIGAFPAAEPAPRRGPVVPASGMLLTAALQPPEAGDANLRALIRDAQEALRTIKPAIDDFRAALRRLEPEVTGAVKDARQAIASVNDVLSPENRKELAELIKNINTVSTNIVKFVGTLGNVLDQAEKTLKNIDTQVNAVGLVIGDVRAVTKPLATRAESLVTSVADSAQELSQVITEIRKVVMQLAREDGTVQKLISDPTVYRNLDDAVASVARITARAEKITRDLEVFADKVARRPELIGLGGVVRPSAGLKELPNAPVYRPDWPPSTSARPSSGPSWLPPPSSEPAWGPPPPIQGYKP
jgi:ABC-type transporter Mla subunit MlaD